MKQHAVNWFEIPVTDMERAMTFYQDVFGYKLELQPEMEGMLMAWFPMEEGATGATGALVKHEMYRPSMEGSKVYFSAASGDLNNELGKVEAAGGKILMPKKDIGEYGFIAMIADTEGNAIALHSEK